MRPDMRAVVFIPVAILSGMFAMVVAALIVDGRFGLAPLVGGSVAFACAAALLVLHGIRQSISVEKLALMDSLTGLPNRRALHADYLHLSRDAGEMAIALVDLDGFVLVNEQYGHQIGDETIRECASILMGICKGEASVYRLGGDEFALVKEGPLAGNIVEGLSRKAIERLSAAIHIGERRLNLGASIGLTRSTSGAAVASSEMLRRADVAMYESKRAGKGRCTWFIPDFDRSREQTRELDDDLRSALANQEFDLHYQPLVHCDSRRVVAVESLIRWNPPGRGAIGPDVFIPAAEKSGLINPIGLWVLRRACRDALAWEGIKLSVNISAAQLRNPEFPIQLGQILEETGFDPERLELEITETCLVIDPKVAERSLGVIRGFGVKVVLDDFGTGYASFGFLRRFRFEKLKLDRSLIANAGHDDGSRAMMLSSITVARAMNMGVTAEGVETREQAEMVRAAGCDTIQGWHYFKAMPASDIPQYLGRRIEAPRLFPQAVQPEGKIAALKLAESDGRAA
ncbi:putative bifunctional diguanylate cyclase/phosphodiesterase [Qipengyuania spongiae]|uniref:Bifunctional diguanylate cyclase/phosphodiesterase n=1 Tax=Qipengyuania spongiae TaxID=2909673 RepID=A0ABY5T1L0_9SPHN|nr:bifunctional diguanylate cyclase/phosphodiesterase [Qipengyuania spongiae]UVI40295.1 bifunctional diguanylate cyclase/phosphodiesterase [Qipengyuania spongiae]